MINRLLVLFVLFQCSPFSTPFLVQTFHHKRNHVATLLKEATETTQYETAEERFNARWNVMFERLKKYKEEHGDCLVPRGYEDDPQLGCWVNNQRQAAPIDENIAQQRRDKLNSIGFAWSVRKQRKSTKLDKKWNDKFERLKAYKREYGDCLVPDRWPEDPQLGRWVAHQRSILANGKLRSDRRTQLESIGFVRSAGKSLTEYEEQWETMFSKLEEYRERHGDCMVPTEYKEDLKLANWVYHQRRRGRPELDQMRQERLDSIGFVWDPLGNQWETMFAKLEEYRDKHGDCLVPKEYKKDDAQLGWWVQTQRRRRPKLDPRRQQRLDSIGFVWRVR